MTATNRIAEQRTRLGVTMDQLANRCGWPKAKISRLESGSVTLDRKSLETIANELEIEPWELLNNPAEYQGTTPAASKFLLDFALGLMAAAETEQERLAVLTIFKKAAFANSLTIEDAATLIEGVMGATEGDAWRVTLKEAVEFAEDHGGEN